MNTTQIFAAILALLLATAAGYIYGGTHWALIAFLGIGSGMDGGGRQTQN